MTILVTRASVAGVQARRAMAAAIPIVTDPRNSPDIVREMVCDMLDPPRLWSFRSLAIVARTARIAIFSAVQYGRACRTIYTPVVGFARAVREETRTRDTVIGPRADRKVETMGESSHETAQS
jgi:hypothetical protein